MNLLQKSLIGFSLVLFLSAFSNVNAQTINPLSAQELSTLCKDYSGIDGSSDALQCVRYIKGFIDGAAASKTRYFNYDKPDANASNFTDRAMSMRIGNRMKKQNHVAVKSFCIEQDDSIDTVVAHVVSEAKQLQADDESALDFVKQALRQKFPC